MEKKNEVAMQSNVDDRFMVFIGSAIIPGPSASANEMELNEFFDYTKKYNEENKESPARVYDHNGKKVDC